MTPLREIVDALLSYAGWPRRERWLAELVVRLVESEQHQRSSEGYLNEYALELALRNYGITQEQFKEIKRRLDV